MLCKKEISEVCKTLCTFSLNNMLRDADYFGHPNFYENLTVLLFQLNTEGEYSYNFNLAIYDKSLRIKVISNRLIVWNLNT